MKDNIIDVGKGLSVAKFISADVDWDKVTTLGDIKTLLKHCNFKITGYEQNIHPELRKYMINIQGI